MKEGRLLAVLGGLLALSCFVGPMRNPDLWWHLSAARFILETGTLPHVDFLSHTRAGAPWSDFEWLTQLLYYGVHAAAGCGGLILLRIALAGALFAVSATLLSLYGLGPAAQGLLVLLEACVLCPYGDVRPDNFSLLFFAVTLLSLEAGRLGRLRWTPQAQAALAALFALWANLHLGFLYGFALLFFYGQWRLLVYCVAATLVNPYGWKVFTVVPEHLAYMKILSGTISEWKPPTFSAPWIYPYLTLCIATVITVTVRLRKEKPIPLPQALALAYFGWSSLRHERHLTYFGLVASPLVLSWLDELLPEKQKTWSAVACAGLLAGHVAAVTWPRERGPMCMEPTREVAAFFANEKPALGGLKIYNSWGDGGYLGWKLFPTYKVFYDGRYIFHALLEDSKQAALSAKGWQDYLALHDVRAASMFRSRLKPTFEKKVRRPYYVSYMPARKWALVFWDTERVVFVRRDAVSQSWLAAHELTGLRPDDMARQLLERRSGQLPDRVLAAELERVTRQAPSAGQEARELAVLLSRG